MSLQNHLYSNKTVQGVLEDYIAELYANSDINSVMHANKWSACKTTMNDKSFLKELRSFFNRSYDIIEKNHTNLQFSISGRRKSIVSTEKKILKYLSMNKSLDLIRDFYAFRIIIFSHDSIDLVEHCYKVAENIIDLGISEGFIPCEYSDLVDAKDLNIETNPYNKAFKYKQYVKDYICFPKKNGYQSIHFALADAKGRRLEVQIRTLDMHAQIEANEETKHSGYKEKTYTIDFPLEREKIQVNGYQYLNNQVFDYAGIEEAVTCFKRTKIF